MQREDLHISQLIFTHVPATSRDSKPHKSIENHNSGVTITIEVDLVLFTGGYAWKIETLPVDWVTMSLCAVLRVQEEVTTD